MSVLPSGTSGQPHAPRAARAVVIDRVRATAIRAVAIRAVAIRAVAIRAAAIRAKAKRAAAKRAVAMRLAAICMAVICASAVAACSRDGDNRESDSRSTPRPRESVASARSVTVAADTDDFGAPLPRDTSASARIVSLNPMATEVLFVIGAGHRLVGRSAWDEYPAEVKNVTSVGDGIRPNVEAVLGVKPTLVILYATAENRAAAEAFRRAGVRTMSLRVDHIAQFMTFTERLGVAVGQETRARAVRDSVQHTLDAVRAAMRGAVPRRVVWPVWLSPVMVIGGGSYLSELLEIAGGTNVFHDLEAPSPQVSVEEIARRDPDMVIGSDKTQSAIRAVAAWRSIRAVREQHWVIDDPAITGRPSVVLGMAAVSLARALHPDRASALPR